MNWSKKCCLPAVLCLFTAITAHSGEVRGLERLGPHAFGQLAADERSANSAVFVGADAALVVDPGLTPAIAREFLNQAQKQIGAVPIRYILLTHWHPDHALGALCNDDTEISILAHPTTAAKLRQSEAGLIQELTQQGFEDCTLRFPDHVIADREMIDLGETGVEIFHPGHGHTAGDLVAWSEADRVLATGDIFMHAASPYLGESDPQSLVNILDSLVDLDPVRVVGGHFGPSNGADLGRFRDYITSLVSQVAQSIDEGKTNETVVTDIDMKAFADFGQYPQYNATFAGNAGDVAKILKREVVAAQFKLLARLEVGQAPHQISFSADGATAYIAAAGSDKITMVDTGRLEISGEIAAPGVPLGVIPLTDGESLAVTRFQGDSIMRYNLANGEVTGELKTGGAPSLIQGPFPGNLYLVAVEKANTIWLFDADTFEMAGSFPTGGRPFPGSATSDGTKIFVPNLDDGTVTVLDAASKQVLATTSVGPRPSGGAVLPGDKLYAAAVLGENRVALIDTQTYEITSSITDGIGEAPFSVVLSANRKLAFVNNTGSNDVSVIDLTNSTVIARVKTGELPIVMAVHPDGKSLWVSCEDSHDVYVFKLPPS